MNQMEIRGARARLGMSRKDTAEKIGMNFNTYTNKELGHTAFKDSEKLALATALGLTFDQADDWLYDGILKRFLALGR